MKLFDAKKLCSAQKQRILYIDYFVNNIPGCFETTNHDLVAGFTIQTDSELFPQTSLYQVVG